MCMMFVLCVVCARCAWFFYTYVGVLSSSFIHSNEPHTHTLCTAYTPLHTALAAPHNIVHNDAQIQMWCGVCASCAAHQPHAHLYKWLMCLWRANNRAHRCGNSWNWCCAVWAIATQSTRAGNRENKCTVNAAGRRGGGLLRVARVIRSVWRVLCVIVVYRCGANMSACLCTCASCAWCVCVRIISCAPSSVYRINRIIGAQIYIFVVSLCLLKLIWNKRKYIYILQNRKRILENRQILFNKCIVVDRHKSYFFIQLIWSLRKYKYQILKKLSWSV